MMSFLHDLTTVAAVLAVVAINVVILAPVVSRTASNADSVKREFHIACASAGGATAWDGRQWVCIK